MALLIVALLVVGLVLAAVDALRTRGESLVAWAVIAVVAALLVWRYL